MREIRISNLCLFQKISNRKFSIGRHIISKWNKTFIYEHLNNLMFPCVMSSISVIFYFFMINILSQGIFQITCILLHLMNVNNFNEKEKERERGRKREKFWREKKLQIYNYILNIAVVEETHIHFFFSLEISSIFSF